MSSPENPVSKALLKDILSNPRNRDVGTPSLAYHPQPTGNPFLDLLKFETNHERFVEYEKVRKHMPPGRPGSLYSERMSSMSARNVKKMVQNTKKVDKYGLVRELTHPDFPNEAVRFELKEHKQFGNISHIEITFLKDGVPVDHQLRIGADWRLETRPASGTTSWKHVVQPDSRQNLYARSTKKNPSWQHLPMVSPQKGVHEIVAGNLVYDSVNVSGDVQKIERLEVSVATYDKHGRVIARTDYTDHGMPRDHTSPHHRTFTYHPGGRVTQSPNKPGPYPGDPKAGIKGHPPPDGFSSSVREELRAAAASRTSGGKGPGGTGGAGVGGAEAGGASALKKPRGLVSKHGLKFLLLLAVKHSVDNIIEATDKVEAIVTEGVDWAAGEMGGLIGARVAAGLLSAESAAAAAATFGGLAAVTVGTLVGGVLLTGFCVYLTKKGFESVRETNSLSGDFTANPDQPEAHDDDVVPEVPVMAVFTFEETATDPNPPRSGEDSFRNTAWLIGDHPREPQQIELNFPPSDRDWAQIEVIAEMFDAGVEMEVPMMHFYGNCHVRDRPGLHNSSALGTIPKGTCLPSIGADFVEMDGLKWYKFWSDELGRVVHAAKSRDGFTDQRFRECEQGCPRLYYGPPPGDDLEAQPEPEAQQETSSSVPCERCGQLCFPGPGFAFCGNCGEALPEVFDDPVTYSVEPNPNGRGSRVCAPENDEDCDRDFFNTLNDLFN